MFIDNSFVHTNEQIPYDQFFSNVKQLSHKQNVFYTIIYTKNKIKIQQQLCIFFTWGTSMGKTFTLMCIIKNMLQYYILEIINQAL